MTSEDYLLPGDAPVYERIVRAVKLRLAERTLQPGERLPTVRALAHALGLNPNTVAKAYAVLERDGVVIARQGSGTFVAVQQPDDRPVIQFQGSHDPALDVLWGILGRARQPVRVDASTVGSLWGLVALEREEADLAGTHLFDSESGTYNLPWLRRVLPGRRLAVMRLADRQQGLMYRGDMHRSFRSIDDLASPNVRFINRQRGSGTRLLLDQHLRRMGIPPRAVRGYEHEVATHQEVASAVASGQADVGLGVYSAARTLDLQFLPIATEQYDLVALADGLPPSVLDAIRRALRSDDFRHELAVMGGYTTDNSGELRIVEVAI